MLSIYWIKENLFSSWLNSIISLCLIYFLFKTIPPILDWFILEATFIADDNTGCTSEGACWAIIGARFNQFMYGFYPAEEIWRVNLVFILLPFAILPLLWDMMPFRKQFIYFAIVFPFLVFFLLYGGLGLTEVKSNKWGGLLLTLFLGIGGILIAFPMSVFLALGRRSKMPAISALCTIFIEFIRGVPLITLLFFGSIMLPLFLPEGLNLDTVIRALVAVTLFQAAYAAEVIRGGLQAMPKGQYEAAQALGLSYWQMNYQIILPQALKITIPALVNTALGLFKDTSLVIIIGLMDLLGVGRMALTDSKWYGLSYEVYAFVAAVFFIFCFGFSRYSLYLEKKLNTDNDSENK
jgi:general L-amino acid transport system permease protein